MVCDVCPVSNVRLAAAASLEVHALRALVERRSISTVDPQMCDTDLARDYAAAALGRHAEAAFRAGIEGAPCDDTTRNRLRVVAGTHPWNEHDDESRRDPTTAPMGLRWRTGLFFDAPSRTAISGRGGEEFVVSSCRVAIAEGSW